MGLRTTEHQALQQALITVKVALLLVPCDPADPMVLEVSPREEDMFESFGSPHRKSPTYEQFLFQEHVHKSNLILSSTKLA